MKNAKLINLFNDPLTKITRHMHKLCKSIIITL